MSYFVMLYFVILLFTLNFVLSKNNMMSLKYIKSSDKYKNVYIYEINGKITYVADTTINFVRHKKNCKTEREAAITVDKIRIENKLNPINILVRKQ